MNKCYDVELYRATGGVKKEDIIEIEQKIEKNTLNIAAKLDKYQGTENAGKILCIDENGNAEPIANYNLPVMTETTVGGAKAVMQTNETVPVAIDKNGQLFVHAQGAPTTEQVENAVNRYLTENPVQSGATEKQVKQINKNTADISAIQENYIKHPEKTRIYSVDSDYELYAEKSLVGLDGNITDNNNFNVYKAVLKGDERCITQTFADNKVNPCLVVYDANDEPILIPNIGQHSRVALSNNASYVLINIGTAGAGVKSFECKIFSKLEMLSANRYLYPVEKKNTKYGYAIIQNKENANTSQFIARIKNISGVSWFKDGEKIPYPGSCYDKDDNYIGDIKNGDNGELILQDGTDYFKLNFLFYDGDLYYEYKGYSPNNKITTYSTSQVTDLILKPFDFNNKKITLFGDSIAFGYMSDGSGKKWADLFAEKVGAALENKAISGSCITTGANDTQSITDTILSYTSETDFILIAGGTNDYSQGAIIGTINDSSQNNTLYGCLKRICEHLSTHFSEKPVIWITPINRSDIINSDIEKLNAVRNAIYQIASIHVNHSVLNGENFGFPLNTGEYQQLVLKDNLHPTAIGNELYYKKMISLLI